MNILWPETAERFTSPDDNDRELAMIVKRYQDLIKTCPASVSPRQRMLQEKRGDFLFIEIRSSFRIAIEKEALPYGTNPPELLLAKSVLNVAPGSVPAVSLRKMQPENAVKNAAIPNRL